MGKRIAMAAVAFLAVCGMGLIVGSAGGVTWGSMTAGFITFSTFMFATLAFEAAWAREDKTP